MTDLVLRYTVLEIRNKQVATDNQQDTASNVANNGLSFYLCIPDARNRVWRQSKVQMSAKIILIEIGILIEGGAENHAIGKVAANSGMCQLLHKVVYLQSHSHGSARVL